MKISIEIISLLDWVLKRIKQVHFGKV